MDNRNFLRGFGSLILFLAAAGFCQASPYGVVWAVSDRGEAYLGIDARALAVDASGYAYVGGRERLPGRVRAWVRKYDPRGNAVWTYRHSQPRIETDRSGVWDIAVGRFGNVFVTGRVTSSTMSASGMAVWVAKLTEDGRLAWERIFRAPVRGSKNTGKAIVVDSSDNVFITGYLTDTALTAGRYSVNDWDEEIREEDDAWVWKLDAGGNILWSARSGSRDQAHPRDIAVDSEGSSFVVGANRHWSRRNSYWVKKFTSSGTLAWTKPTLVPFSGSDAVAINDKGRLLTVGIHHRDGNPDRAWFVEYDSDGRVVWSSTQNVIAAPQRIRSDAYSFALDSLGRKYLAGEQYRFENNLRSGESEAWVARFSTAGSLDWSHTFMTPSSIRSTGTIYAGNLHGYTNYSFRNRDYVVRLDFDDQGHLFMLSNGGIDFALWKCRIPGLTARRSAADGRQSDAQAAPAEDELPEQEVLAVALTKDIKSGTPTRLALQYVNGRSINWVGPDTKKIYCWTSVRSKTVPSKLTHVWYREGKKMAEVELKVLASPFRTWSSKNIWPGNWRVEVLGRDGEVLAVEELQVSDTLPY